VKTFLLLALGFYIISSVKVIGVWLHVMKLSLKAARTRTQSLTDWTRVRHIHGSAGGRQAPCSMSRTS